MKTVRNISLFILFIFFNSCMDEYTEVFTANSPIYMSFENLRNAVKSTAATELENTGKIYFKDGYIFVNEEMKEYMLLITETRPVRKIFYSSKFRKR